MRTRTRRQAKKLSVCNALQVFKKIFLENFKKTVDNRKMLWYISLASGTKPLTGRELRQLAEQEKIMNANTFTATLVALGFEITARNTFRYAIGSISNGHILTVKVKTAGIFTAEITDHRFGLHSTFYHGIEQQDEFDTTYTYNVKHEMNAFKKIAELL